jgi:pectate lyase
MYTDWGKMSVLSPNRVEFYQDADRAFGFECNRSRHIWCHRYKLLNLSVNTPTSREHLDKMIDIPKFG